ncbi:Glucanosyltransferase-domain-containing protein [Irpex rosettiformis]|uniref:Glucanosyltransferase-domain-containing protein n=1 Tax=Irpex rosettiformis TaxID=378272 RepID=A0ACB8ULS3_9APHY|nr:Glucanosyltransferase-domain-containing protein [Irpex rosettiformis]
MFSLRGELCIGSATFLSLVSLLLLIFMHVGQINTSNVPRHISMVIAPLSSALAAATAPDPIPGLYTDNSSAPLQVNAGLRTEYKFGLYSYCAYVNDTHGICSNSTAGTRLEPYVAFLGDIPSNYTGLTNSFIPEITFTNSSYLGDFSRGGYYLLLLGSISVALALFTGLIKHALGFLLSTVFSLLATVLLLIGAVIWTVIVKKAQDINGWIVPLPSGVEVPLGISVSLGNGLLLAWAAFACIAASLIPYMIRWIAAAAFFASGVQAAVQKVTRQGKYLYNADGSRFFIKGVAYQPQGDVVEDPNNPFLEPSTFIDPLADSNGCARDIPFLQQLNVTAIRVYSVNSSANHDSCMQALSGAGIYTIIDLSLPLSGSIDRLSPAWTTDLLDTYLRTIDAFTKYDNVLAYNVGNEVVTAANGTAAAAFVKAAARDVKAYLKSKSSSALVGYAAIDAPSDWLIPFAEYLACDPTSQNSGATALDLFGLNNYECGSDPASVYASKNAAFANYNVAAYFSEFGCLPSPRSFVEVETIFASPMTDVWSGALAFSYFPAQSAQGQFGMVTINGNTVTTSQDFDNLKTEFGKISPPNSPTSGTDAFPSCPAQNTSQLASTTLPPTPNDNSCNCVNSAVACQFKAPTTNTTELSIIVGNLLNVGCSLLGSSGGTCDDIAADGGAGKYGAVSACSPAVKLSWVFDQYYEKTNRNAQSCDFSGNATVNSAAPANSAAVASAVSSCLASPDATFVPSAPSSTNGGSQATGSSGSSSGGSSGSNGNSNNGASGALGGSQPAVFGAALASLFALAGGLLVLA